MAFQGSAFQASCFQTTVPTTASTGPIGAATRRGRRVQQLVQLTTFTTLHVQGTAIQPGSYTLSASGWATQQARRVIKLKTAIHSLLNLEGVGVAVADGKLRLKTLGTPLTEALLNTIYTLHGEASTLRDRVFIVKGETQTAADLRRMLMLHYVLEDDEFDESPLSS